MTEGVDTGEALARVLALVATPLNQRGRSQLLDLLPQPTSNGVADWLRRGHELTGDALSPLEAAIAERFGPRDDEEATEEQDARDEEEATEEEQDADHDEVEAFFAEGEPPGPEETDPGTRLPETLIARLLQVPGPGSAAGLLAELPLTMQGEVVVLLATSTPLSAARALDAEERGLFQALRRQLEPEGPELWGVDPACAVLRGLRGTRRLRRALGSAAEVDDEAATIIQNHLFDFSDLMRLREVELQVLLGRVDNPTLARALVGASEAVTDRIFANASDRRAALLRDEGELYTEITPEEVERARTDVLATVRYLYERGSITTYFGSIARAAEWDGEAEEEEEDEEEGPSPSDGEDGPEEPIAPPPPPRSRARLLLAGLGVAAVVLLAVSLGQLLSREPTAAARSQRDPRAGTAGGGRVLMMTEQERPAVGEGEASAPRTLAPGQVLRVPEGIEAVLQFPAPSGEPAARVEVSEGAEVEGLADAAGADSAATGLFLRAGRVTVTVIDEGFAVRTPLVSVSGTPGSVFRLRVVLDATTTVAARRGRVWVATLTDERIADLAPGEQARVDPRGGVELSP